MVTLEEKIAQLPPAARNEISEFVEYFHWKYAGDQSETTEKGEREKLKQLLLTAKEKLLALEEDWDDRGAKPIKEATIQRIIEFLSNLHAIIIHDCVGWIFPEIFPGTKGKILIQWKAERFQLVIVIPEDPVKPTTYYATDYGKNEVEGTASNERLNNLYLNWTRQF